jgi:RNA polymerase primary sigma factor
MKHETLSADVIDPRYRTSRLRQGLFDAIATLKPRDQEIVKMRYGLDGDGPFTLEEVGLYFNLSRERVRQIEAGFLRLAKAELSDT